MNSSNLHGLQKNNRFDSYSRGNNSDLNEMIEDKRDSYIPEDRLESVEE